MHGQKLNAYLSVRSTDIHPASTHFMGKFSIGTEFSKVSLYGNEATFFQNNLPKSQVDTPSIINVLAIEVNRGHMAGSILHPPGFNQKSKGNGCLSVVKLIGVQ